MTLAMIGKPMPELIYTTFHAGAVLGPDKPIPVLKLPPGEDAQKFAEEVEGRRLSIRICYSSLFDECWLSDSFEDHPKAVGECRSDPAKEFQQ